MAALVGICVVNVPFMAMPAEAAFIAPDRFPDKIANLFVVCFLQLKFFLLFSFIFGWGMGVQSRSAASTGQSFASRYFRRMVGLAVLGGAHATLVFSGDILLLYAVLGTCLWLVRDFTPGRLIKLAAWMVPLAILFLGLLAIAVDSIVADEGSWAAANKGVGGGFLEATRARIMGWPDSFGFLFFLQGPLAFGAIAAGLAAAKTDFFSEDSCGYRLLQQRLPLLLIIAMPLNILYAAVVGGIVSEAQEVLSLSGFVLIAIGAPALSLIYLYLLIRLSRMIRMPRLLVLAGQNSLSSYVVQGVLAGFCFGSYGLGLFNSLGNAELVPLSILIALIAMVFVGMFASLFGRGPLEPILRGITGS